MSGRSASKAPVRSTSQKIAQSTSPCSSTIRCTASQWRGASSFTNVWPGRRAAWFRSITAKSFFKWV